MRKDPAPEWFRLLAPRYWQAVHRLWVQDWIAGLALSKVAAAEGYCTVVAADIA